MHTIWPGNCCQSLEAARHAYKTFMAHYTSHYEHTPKRPALWRVSDPHQSWYTFNVAEQAFQANRAWPSFELLEELSVSSDIDHTQSGER